MIVRGLIVLSMCMQLGLTANTQHRDRNEPTISECAAKGGECDENRGRPVCGTDDQTYPTRCHLLRVQCSGHQVSLKYRGPCKACKEARDYAVKHKTKSPPKFIPRCKTDGTYAAIQCLGDSGCWCSDITGKPIENTSVRTGKPKCREFNKPNIRRSPARHLSPARGRRTCTQIDRAAFNSNLIKVFQSEYIRSGQHQRDISAGVEGAAGSAGPSGGFVPPADKLVLDWKFAQLDANTNEMLDKSEFRELKKLVKRAVKPRRCGRAFGKFCDVDNDDRLSRSEWNFCISKDGINPLDHKFNVVNGGPTPQGYNHNQNTKSNNNLNNSNNIRNRNTLYLNHHRNHANNHHNTIHSTNNNNNNPSTNLNQNHKNQHHSSLDDLDGESEGDDEESSQHLDYDDDADYDPEEEGDDDDNLSMPHKFIGSSTNLPSIYFLRPKSDIPMKESEGESDCLADQAAALEEQRHGGTIIYVPDCTPDGRYQRVQCYRSTPYCWCVHEDSGKNIPGTSVKDKRPQCDAIYSAPRPMKGCPEPRKSVFLKELKEFLKTQLISGANTGANSTNWSSEDERIATLSFVLLDKNKNKAWERKEWKTFRELMSNSQTLRKCGKKMPRYCDVNSDKKITLSEWLNCLQTLRIDVAATTKATQTNESVTSKPSKLTGSNPLEQYLKD